MSRSLQSVHVRVGDAATKQALPVRLCITDAAGAYYAPLGRLQELPSIDGDVGGNVVVDGQTWAYIDGA